MLSISSLFLAVLLNLVHYSLYLPNDCDTLRSLTGTPPELCTENEEMSMSSNSVVDPRMESLCAIPSHENQGNIHDGSSPGLTPTVSGISLTISLHRFSEQRIEPYFSFFFMHFSSIGSRSS